MTIDDRHGNTVLHLLAAGPSHHNAYLQVLMHIDGGEDPNAQNEDGDPPAHIAVRTGNEFVLQALIKRKASMEVTNDAGRTPLGVDARKS